MKFRSFLVSGLLLSALCYPSGAASGVVSSFCEAEGDAASFCGTAGDSLTFCDAEGDAASFCGTAGDSLTFCDAEGDAASENVDLKAVLDTMADGSVMTLSCTLSGTSPKGPVSGSGTILYCCDAFVFRSGAFRIYDDGRTRWTVDSSSKEATAECSSEDFLSTESVLRLCGVNPKSANVSYGFERSGALESISASFKNGTKVKIVFKVKKKEPRGTEASFTERFFFDSRTLDSSWVITDLR